MRKCHREWLGLSIRVVQWPAEFLGKSARKNDHHGKLSMQSTPRPMPACHWILPRDFNVVVFVLDVVRVGPKILIAAPSSSFKLHSALPVHYHVRRTVSVNIATNGGVSFLIKHNGASCRTELSSSSPIDNMTPVVTVSIVFNSGAQKATFDVIMLSSDSSAILRTLTFY